jgi:pre-mRNA cleavage complex 2 protein Pcf11
MEQFKSVWHAKTQQPVWMDTIKVGDKYYHASCYQEVKEKSTRGKVSASIRNGGSARETPERVLGKRKFEGA